MNRAITRIDPIVTFFLLAIFLTANNNNSVIITEADPNTGVRKYECNINSWGTGINNPYALNVAYVLDELSYNAAGDPSLANYTTRSYQGTTVYGYAKCNPKLSEGDCWECLEDASQWLLDKCATSIGAHVVMKDCRKRYENYAFSGA